ncbi:energy-coupling factor ABC transporter ATP-binding protein [Synechococcus sp. PCC 6312]|uniref:energy-coupling factor ABC transporter ATP-binding protein n=1 Tax=Synechococcus sp. (strain ATCC 27167 / PCC 6312) TaxID=195253 RepID=UPI00029EDDF5|nr:ABC transporter ATP-binding protein [Synechococcus sp. PCC 6312]AFY60145.1 ABC-type cobalt transport system, ATPase component [Synechococcus sp. PCC 6312]
MALLTFQDVSYRYPCTEAVILKHLNLDIPAHKKTVILGHNGCGKSTLLCLANGLYRPQTGILLWRGQPLGYGSQELRQWRQRVGLAFQNPEHQLVAGTVAEDISYGLCNLKLPKPQIVSRLSQALQDFGLEALSERPLHQLSLGQKRRVALAGVMALEPELLLLDEPTAFLDSRQIRLLLGELTRIAEAGTTILMATHDLHLAQRWADWLVILHQGQVALTGPPPEVFSKVTALPELDLYPPY